MQSNVGSKPISQEVNHAQEVPENGGSEPIYQVKISFSEVEPSVWRRVQVEECTLAELHDVIQVCMGWSNSHLYAFDLDGEEYSDLETGDDGDMNDAGALSLGEIFEEGPREFTYQSTTLATTGNTSLRSRRRSRPKRRSSIPGALPASGPVLPRTAAGPIATRTYSRPFATRTTPSTRKCWNWWAARSTRQHSTWTA